MFLGECSKRTMQRKLCVVFAFIFCINGLLAIPRERNVLHSRKEFERQLSLIQDRRRCPLCDSSVYSYCSDKLFHDSCCCSNPNNPHYPLPPECNFADCSFLHANSCQEHKLITACCCISHLNLH